MNQMASFSANEERKMKVFPTKKELSVAIAKYAADLSAKFCKERGYFTVVLSGGDLIEWLSELLKPSYRDAIEWGKWHIFWVDERVVPLDSKDSNYKLAMDRFLSKVPIPPANIYGIDKDCAASGDAKRAAVLYEECIKRLVSRNIIRTHKASGYPQFDLQLLGMGPDGHMASLFPGSYHIDKKANLVTFITNSPKPPLKRITLTLPVINCASYNLMAVCDEAQADAVAKVFNNNMSLPATSLRADTEAIWYLDRAAASKLYYRARNERKKEVFPTKKELAKAMAKYTSDLSAKYCKERGYFTVVLSGGDLIDWLSELLKPSYLESIEWSKWHVFWVDERVVPLDHKDSNYKLAWDGFVSKVGIPIANIYAIDQDSAALGDAKGAALLYEECIKRLVNRKIIRTYKASGFPQFDLQLLGMGPDGHMASLFPEHYQIEEKANLVTFITDSPKPPSNRITFTLAVINCASYNLMAVCGETHANAVASVFHDNLELPATLLTADTEAIWFLDQAAASKI